MHLLKTRAVNHFKSIIGNSRPLPIQIDITNACNLACKHCYHHDHNNTGAIPFDGWTSILDQYSAIVKKYAFESDVIFCGGEPTMSRYLNPLIEHVYNNNPKSNIKILTNGIHSKNFDSKTKTGRPKITFQVSIDGPNAEIHDSNRGIGNFERALSGVRFYKAQGHEVTLLSVLSSNTAPYIEDYFKLAKTLQVTKMSFTRLINQGQAIELIDTLKDRTLTPNELKRAYQEILIYSAMHGVETGTNGPLWTLINPALGNYSNFEGAIVIDYQGYLIASSRSRIRIAKINEFNLEDAYFNNEYHSRLRLKDVTICGACEQYRKCGGDRNAAYGESGDFFGHDPGCWKEDLKWKTY